MAKRTKPAWDPRKSAAQTAKAVLPVLTARYVRAARKFAQGQPSRKALQKFSRRTKGFSYTVELFRPCLGRRLDSRLEELRNIQHGLSEINDCVQSRRLLFGKQQPGSDLPAQELRQFIETRAAERTAELLEHLRRSFRGVGRQRWWTNYDAPRAPRQARPSHP